MVRIWLARWAWRFAGCGGTMWRLDPRSSAMKLHLGCGNKYIPGFYHVDILPMPHVDHVGSAERLDFIRDNSVDLIYACHILEHYGRHETRNVLSEWHRVLKPEGILRLAVPDFAAVCHMYD